MHRQAGFSYFSHFFLLVIIDNLNFKSIAVAPYEADAVLIVDSYAVLSETSAFEGLQMVAGKYSKIRKYNRSVDLQELSLNERCQAIETL